MSDSRKQIIVSGLGTLFIISFFLPSVDTGMGTLKGHECALAVAQVSAESILSPEAYEGWADFILLTQWSLCTVTNLCTSILLIYFVIRPKVNVPTWIKVFFLILILNTISVWFMDVGFMSGYYLWLASILLMGIYMWLPGKAQSTGGDATC